MNSPHRGRAGLLRQHFRAIRECPPCHRMNATSGLSKNFCSDDHIFSVGTYRGRASRVDAKRDWGHARDYVEGMWRILQCPEPDDYVLATGETHSVREFVEKAFAQIGVRIVWQGAGVDEKGVDARSGRVLVQIDPRYFRPTEVDLLIGDPSKARSKLGWQHRVSFDELVSEMVAADLKAVGGERLRVLTVAH